MDSVSVISKLTVFFEEPFWVGLYERETEGRYAVCKVTFGTEPSDSEVYQIFLDRWRMLNFSASTQVKQTLERKKNPKRIRREIAKQMKKVSVGTKAQQALKKQREEKKVTCKSRARTEREAEKTQKFLMRQKKRREKHRGH